jgi:hypothetical protein
VLRTRAFHPAALSRSNKRMNPTRISAALMNVVRARGLSAALGRLSATPRDWGVSRRRSGAA